MTTRPFMQVDVFTERPYLGNPVAVVLDASGLDASAMQAIARWTNLSETTFVLPPDDPKADYRLRIFTPDSELPFAGHPTIGSAWALLQSGRATPRDGRLVQQCNAGLVPIAVDWAAGPSAPVARRAQRIWLRLPPTVQRALDARSRAALERALGAAAIAEPRIVDVGPVWLVARLASDDAVLSLRPDAAAVAALSRELGLTGVTVFGASASQDAAAWEVRSFAPAHGIVEDPVCGSGNGCVAAYLRSAGAARGYRARQGRAVGRDGHVDVRYDDDDDGIEIGGAAVVCVTGEIVA
ncbi:MAG TPA: PhzF family phenazine biosynthesis protein [Zeimonas sp.]|nr:PhzF family phenazine biosynthesis protein [Zeimonas sp.]